MLLPAVEAVLEQSPSKEAKRIFLELLSPKEHKEWKSLGYELGASVVVGAFLQRRIDAWLAVGKSQSPQLMVSEQRRLRLRFAPNAKSILLELHYSTRLWGRSYDRQVQALLPLYTKQRRSAAKETKANEASKDAIWTLHPLQRGQVLRKHYGANLPLFHPVVARLEGGSVTAIRSLDLTAPSYASQAAAKRALAKEKQRLLSLRSEQLQAAHTGGRPPVILERKLWIIVPTNAPEHLGQAWQTKEVLLAREQGLVLRFIGHGRHLRDGKP